MHLLSNTAAQLSSLEAVCGAQSRQITEPHDVAWLHLLVAAYLSQAIGCPLSEQSHDGCCDEKVQALHDD
jgi:hypothetical protein